MEFKRGVVYRNVVYFAKKKQLSITKLEELAGLKNGTIGKWNPEKEKPANPSLDSLAKLSKALGVSINRLLKERAL
jgi:transcriptional regulator with XRE-family HTH domain